MKRLSGLLMCVALFSVGAAAQGREFKRTVAFEAGGALTLNVDVSRVRLTSWDQPQVDISARIEAPKEAGAEYGQRVVEATRIEVEGDARALTIRTNFGDIPYEGLVGRSRRLPTVHFEIRAPRALNLSLEADRSEVELQGFERRLSLQTDRTTVRAAALSGEIRLHMDRGRATLTGLRGTLDIETDRTDLELEAAQVAGDSRLDVSRGEAALRLTDAQGLTLRADLDRRGDFNSDFQITTQTFGGRRLEGTINGGGPQLSIKTDRARIRIMKSQG